MTGIAEDVQLQQAFHTYTVINVHHAEEPTPDVFDSNEAEAECWILRRRACKRQTGKQSMSNHSDVGQNHYVTTV